MTYRVISHLGKHYEGEDLKLANMYADSVIEVEECFGYKTWSVYENKFPTNAIREQVCSEDIYKFISIAEVWE